MKADFIHEGMAYYIIDFDDITVIEKSPITKYDDLSNAINLLDKDNILFKIIIDDSKSVRDVILELDNHFVYFNHKFLAHNKKNKFEFDYTLQNLSIIDGL